MSLVVGDSIADGEPPPAALTRSVGALLGKFANLDGGLRYDVSRRVEAGDLRLWKFRAALPSGAESLRQLVV